MERISSILDNVKERLTNPFVFSYIVSWLTINWRITIGLIWFDDLQLRSTGNFNYKDYITNHVVDWSWFYALLAAAIYTFGVPYFMMLVRIFNAGIIKRSNVRVYKISRKTPISFEKYIELKNKYKKSTDAYAKLMSEENKTAGTLQKTRAELAQQRNEKLEGEKVYLEAQNKLIADHTEIVKGYTENINLKDKQIETMQISIDGFIKENNKLQNYNEDNRRHILRLEQSTKEGDEIILAKNSEINKLKETDESIYSVWKMVRYDDSVMYIEFTNFFPTQIDKRFLAKISTTVVFSYQVLDAVFHKNHRIVVASRSNNNRPTDYFYLFKHDTDSDIWGGYENDNVVKTFERLADSDFHVKT